MKQDTQDYSQYREQLLSIVKAYRGDYAFLPDFNHYLSNRLRLLYKHISTTYDHSLDLLQITIYFPKVGTYSIYTTINAEYVYDDFIPIKAVLD